MAEKTDLNISPYYDDYSESKNFHKVLYRAGRPLQARELTQTQSILQNQVDRLGSHFFEEGSIVSGAQSDVDFDLYFVKVKATNPNSLGDAAVEDYRTSYHGKMIVGQTTGVVGQVITSTAETSTDKLTLFVRFERQGTDTKHSASFSAGETLVLAGIDQNGTVTEDTSSNNDFKVEDASEAPIGRSSYANINEGVVFVRGFFVKVDAQDLILEKYNPKPSYRIGLQIKEEIISTAEDTSLYDNAQGTSNENAAGADRFKYNLVFTKIELTNTDDANFIELLRVNGGVIENKVTRPLYSEIEHTLARRTFDQAGDFVVQQFTHSMREHLDDTTNAGFYTKARGGKKEKFVFSISPGKAYVKGYEIDKVGTTNVTMNKARSTQFIKGAKTPTRLGNYVKAENLFGFPDFGNESGAQALVPYARCQLFEDTLTGGSLGSNDHIGFARVRYVDAHDVSGDTEDGINLYLFDVKMFTKIGYSSHTGTANAGDKLVGGTSGATGIIAYDNDSNALYVHDVNGHFQHGETVTSTGDGTFSCTIVGENYRGIANEVRTFNIDRVRGIGQERTNADHADFTADVIADDDFVLSGSVTISSTAVTGFGTRFTSELKKGDIIIDGAGNEKVIASVTSNIAATLTGAGGAMSNANCTRRRTKIYDQEQAAAIYAWPRDYVVQHVPDTVTVKKQKIISCSGGNLVVDTDNNEQFLQLSRDNFQISIFDLNGASGGSDVLGAEIDPTNSSAAKTSPSATTERYTFSVGSVTDGVDFLVSYAVQLDSPVNRDKTLRRSRCAIVDTAYSAGASDYGTCYDNKDISLGVADAFKVRGIFEGIGGSTPLPPSAILSVASGTPVNDEIIIGQTTGARARIIKYNGGAATYFYYINDFTFSDGESVVGQTSNATATLGTITAGGDNITDRYFFDDGQRDGFYDHSKITLKPGAPSPNNSILIVFDYFTGSGGQFYDVNSYNGIDYDEIPVYSPNKVDLGGLEPDGQFELSDALDFRPSVGQLYTDANFATTQPDPTSPANISSGLSNDPFAYDSKDFTSTGASALDTPVPSISTTGDIKFYVSRIDKIFLRNDGKFDVALGTPALSPTKPKAIDDAIEMFELFIPAFTKDLKKIRVRSFDHRRYTMKDIGKINNRVTNLERITSLSLLEKDTQSAQILDADGFDRFKSGFLVDNFRGHKIGDVNHPDYKCSIDTEMGMLRPQTFQQFFDVSLNTSTSKNYQKTGDLITLPYTTTNYVDQDKASRHINVNPYHVFAFIGNVKLSPETDIWNDSERLPDVRINREGNFDAVVAGVGNSMGTVWNNWQTTWAGTPTVVSTEVQSTSSGSWSGDPTQGGTWQAGTEITRDITETPEIQTRTGITTSVVEDFTETRNDRIVSVSVIPFIRARTIEIDATNLKPNTNHFFFFDGIRVDSYVRPHSTSYSVGGGLTVSDNVKSDGNGRLRAFFELPNSDVQRFPTGQREMKITSSFYNLSNPPSTGRGTYQAQGLLQSSQTEITSTRNGRVITERTTATRQSTRRGERLNVGRVDTQAPPIPVDTTPPEPAEEITVDQPDTETVTDAGTIVEEVVPVVVVDQNIETIVEDIPIPEEVLAIIEEVEVLSSQVDVVPVIPDVQPQNPFLFEIPDLRIVSDMFRPPRIPNLFLGDGFMDINEGMGWGDPLAQSILCEVSGGMMVTGVDLYFQAKSTHMPVSVELRNMVNGYPGQTVYPFSVKTLNPEDVNISEDGSAKTTFTFDSPVFVEENTEFCFVVYSNSNDYECFISRMGETDLITGETISGQPYAGSLFLSQNASTWTAEQTDDLKFQFKIAQFDTTKMCSLYFENDAIDKPKLARNPIQTTASSANVKVANYMHGMYDTSSNVELKGVVGDRVGSAITLSSPTLDTSGGTPADGTYTNQTLTGGTGSGLKVDFTIASGAITDTRIVDPGQGYTANDSCQVQNFNNNADFSVTVASVGQTLGGLPVDAIGGSTEITYTAISNIGIDSFDVTVDLSSYIGNNKFKTGYTALETTAGGGKDVTSSRNYYFDTLHTMIPSISRSGGKIIASTESTAMKSPEGHIATGDSAYTRRSTNNFITLNDNAFLDNPGIVASSINETNEMSSVKSFRLLLQMFTPNVTVSPVIDVGTTGVIAIANRINEINSSTDVPTGVTYSASTEPEGDNNAMVYVTRKVNLKTPATSLKVIADNFRPPTTDLKFMYKLIKADETTPLDDIGFEYFNTDGSPDKAIETDQRNFKEYEYTADDLPEFTGFVVKIVGQGQNSCVVPAVSALRCMALA